MDKLIEENKRFFYDTVQNEYLKITEEYPVNFDKEFDIRGSVSFNSPLFKGEFWHSNNGSGFGFFEVEYAIRVAKKNFTSCFPFTTKEKAEQFLKKTKSKDFPDKTKVKIKKGWAGAWMNTKNLRQLEEITTVLKFKKTNVTVLKWYGENI